MLPATQLEDRGIRDARVIAAVRSVPRERFVPPSMREFAYDDRALDIGFGATISQPYIVAAMSELLQAGPSDRVLEIGTGSGFQAAVLCRLAGDIYSIEVIPELARQAESVLRELGCTNVHIRTGDGYAGWPEEAPFDRIILTAAPPLLPQTLIEQLKPGGRLVAPVGAPDRQQLVVVDKSPEGRLDSRTVFPVSFVPMVART
jgi:protein-L-isoaspartate(D-aspartate) O-methyltransferase